MILAPRPPRISILDSSRSHPRAFFHCPLSTGTNLNATDVDTTPPGMLVFSQTKDCSDIGSDWSVFPYADGMLLAAAPLGGTVGAFGDLAFKLGPNDSSFSIPAHSHQFTSPQNTTGPGCVSFIADGCNPLHIPCNEGYNGCGGISISATIVSTPVTVPIRRLQLCVKN